MRLLIFNRVLRCVQTVASDMHLKHFQKMGGSFGRGPLAALVLLGIILPIAVFTLYIRPGGLPSVRQVRIIKDILRPSSILHKNPPHNTHMSPWQRHINKQCLKHGHLMNETDTVRLKPTLFKHFLVDDKHKVIYCQIPKVATTTWRRIFIVLTGKAGTDDIMALNPNDVHHKHDDLLTYLSDLSEKEIRYRLRHYFKFVFVREPFERVLSAYRNKFDTAYQPLSIFHTLYSRKIMKQYRPKSKQTYSDIQTGKITFPEFIEYLVDPDPPVHSNEHWEHFHELCHPCLVDYDFIGKLESIEDDSEYVLKKSGMNRIIKFPGRRDANYKSKKTNTLMKDFYSEISVRKIKELWNIYKQDFDIFNYTLPEDVKTLVSVS